MKSLGIGLIGLGRHGQRYAHHLLEGIPRCQLVAVCRRDSTKGQPFAKKHSLQFYQDYHDLLTHPEIQAIVVVTPPSEAISIALQAIRHHKPVLIEKPMGSSAKEAQQLLAQSTQEHIPVMVAQTTRYEETIAQLKSYGNKIGTWRYLVLTNRLPPSENPLLQSPGTSRGALLEIGIHQLDLVRFLTGQEVSQVYCEMERSHPENPETRAWVTLHTNSGLPCLLDISRVSQGRFTRTEIIGETGQLIADMTSPSLTLLRKDDHPRVIPLTSQPTIPQVLSDFVDAIQSEIPMPVTGLDGLRAVQIADACYESAKTQRTITISPI
ncbi:Gfo/Idh/MocA family oxidoreductase [Candidatus Nitronereus thalassa]|uniref:Gfo/Idh/MocA family oxidoreductase n=1 Tax=Candidatus Nitronereus thalassa TaxID=3020898 RepID=A0ABU3K5M8_9BACT|nr:Gfo/Idh/MocA family oxidoreductase [Candidatus Nitronereus thalassa]MDT7041686.1 Gfo/Idh/MocA family oxidoreductase [Candidatus Nitronereus thalassa]